ncbi:MAG: PAS domain S-box protein [Leptolyngbyaceae cyanobacterium bins.302]|nr:PAS domain S-box protein [Leptolyngbyaceae cyanobacterium bins.302]
MPMAFPISFPDLIANLFQPGKFLVSSGLQIVVLQIREMPAWMGLALLHLLTFGITIALGLLTTKQIRSRKPWFPEKRRKLNLISKTSKKFESLNHTILNALPDLIIRMHRDGTYLDIKPATAFSTELQNLKVGENIRNILPPKAAQQRLQATEAALETGEVQVYEFSLQNGNQQLRREARVLPLDVDEVLIVIRDLTQRNQIEDALRQSEARFRELAETVQEGFFVYETELAFYSYVNPAYEAIVGVSPHRKHEGMDHWLANIHPDDRDRVKSAILRESQGQNFHEEYRYNHPNGKTSWLRSQAFPLQDETGAIVRVVGTVEDITDRKQLEASLQLSEARYRGIVEDQMEMICRYRSDGTFTFANEAFCRYFEVDLDDLLGHSFEPFIAESDRSRVIQLIRAMTPEHPSVAIENRVFTQGKTRWTQWNNRAIFDHQGSLMELQAVGQDITDRKRMEIALQESEARFQEIAQTLNQVSYVVSLTTGQYLYISPSYEKLWGYSCESLYQDPKSWLERIHPEDLEYVLEGFNQFLSGNYVRLEYRIVCANGEVRWIKSESLVVYDADGNPLRMVGLADDITEHKQLEESLQLSEARYRGIVEDQMELICRYQPDGTLTFANEAFCRYFGLDVNEVLGTRYEPLIFEADQDIVNQHIRSMSLDNPTIVTENRVFSHGAVRWTQWNNRAIFDDRGRFVEFQAVGRDVTDRKQIEEVLRASEERFRRAFDDAPIGMSLVLPTGQFLKANSSYCNLVGYSEAELLNLTFQEITHPEDLEADVEGLKQLCAGEIHLFQIKKRYITKHGTSVPVLMSTAPIRDASGQPLYFVGHIQDIRDRLKIEQMKDEFISVVSHELRTPLTSIRGALGILESGVFNNRPEKAQHMLQIAVNNSDRLVRLVNDILTLERLESGKVQLQMEQCQVASMMQEAVDSVQAIADQASINLCFTPLHATLWASHDAIVQTLTNLLSNAIKFSAIGGTVWLTAEEWEHRSVGAWETGKSHSPPHPSTHSSTPSPHPLAPSPQPAILFAITDHGRGIPSDKFDIIFEEFQQVDGSDSRKKGGTGLGLAICKRIVQQHKGHIWVDSCLGKGSTFYFTVPLFTTKQDQRMTNDQ